MFLDLLPQTIVDSFVIRILLAAFLGACIGLERDIRGRSAGLRTNILVCVGSAVFMILSIAIAQDFMSSGGDPVRTDPTRIAAQIITGIGFLGAGAIIKYGMSVMGLTTAACLWITSAIGMASGSGYYDVAVLTTVIAILVLTVLNKVERFYSKDSYRILKITAHKDTSVPDLLNAIKSKRVDVLFFDEEVLYTEEKLNLTLTIRLRYKDISDEICHNIFQELEKRDFDLYRVAWRHQ